MTHPLPTGPSSPVPSPSSSSSSVVPPPKQPAAASFGALYVVGLGVVAAASLFAYTAAKSDQRNVAQAQQARTAEAKLGLRVLTARVFAAPGAQLLTLPGELHPMHLSTLYAKTAGYLEDLVVDKGDNVSKGQVLGRIASPETDQQLNSATTELSLRRKNLARIVPLVQSGVISKQDLDAAQAALSAAEAEQERLRSLKGYETLVAPFDGVITARFVDPGALLSAATASTTPTQGILEVQDMKTVRVFVYVAQSQAVRVRCGDKAVVSSPDLPGVALQAKVTRTARAIDPRTRTMLVEIDVANEEELLTPGMFVEVGLEVKMAPSLRAPAEAIFLRKGASFAVVVEQGVAHLREVKTGADDGKVVEILSGLKEGEVVALYAGEDVVDGAPVRAVARDGGKP